MLQREALGHVDTIEPSVNAADELAIVSVRGSHSAPMLAPLSRRIRDERTGGGG